MQKYLYVESYVLEKVKKYLFGIETDHMSIDQICQKKYYNMSTGEKRFAWLYISSFHPDVSARSINKLRQILNKNAAVLKFTLNGFYCVFRHDIDHEDQLHQIIGDSKHLAKMAGDFTEAERSSESLYLPTNLYPMLALNKSAFFIETKAVIAALMQNLHKTFIAELSKNNINYLLTLNQDINLFNELVLVNFYGTGFIYQYYGLFNPFLCKIFMCNADGVKTFLRKLINLILRSLYELFLVKNITELKRYII